MNNLSNNPAFMKRMKNAVDLPTKETGNGSIDLLTASLFLLAIVGSVAVVSKIFEPRKIVVNHYYPLNKGEMTPPVTESKNHTQKTVA